MTDTTPENNIMYRDPSGKFHITMEIKGCTALDLAKGHKDSQKMVAHIILNKKSYDKQFKLYNRLAPDKKTTAEAKFKFISTKSSSSKDYIAMTFKDEEDGTGIKGVYYKNMKAGVQTICGFHIECKIKTDRDEIIDIEVKKIPDFKAMSPEKLSKKEKEAILQKHTNQSRNSTPKASRSK